MKFSPRTFGRQALDASVSSVLQAWAMVLGLALVLSVLRLLEIAWHWPAGFSATPGDLWAVAYQGARFDLKVCAAAAVLLFPLLVILPARFHSVIAGTVGTLYVIASLINLHYYGFYKTPIDPVVFGFFEDDTTAILKTIWSDFPVFLTLGVLVLASWAAFVLRRQLHARLSLWVKAQRWPVWATLLALLLALFLLVLTTKGTLRAMALGRQNVTVTTSQFLNDMVPNGVIALNFAWDARRESQNFTDPLAGLKRLGYATPLDAARSLGLSATDEQALRDALFAHGNDGKRSNTKAAPRKNLLFFLMESWSAEPFLYQASDFDVLGRLAPTLDQACHFSNFDSVEPGTHPALEAILFSTPITPLTLGPQGKKPIPWAIPLVLRRAGYRTLFVTSATGGWRELDRVLKTQGFDEVIDASHLQAAFPEAKQGIWGVWDGYIYRYLAKRLKEPQDKPLFVFVLTSTNHPPYDLPADYHASALNPSKWGGDRSSNELWANVETWRYATDQLGAFVQDLRASPLRDNTLIAATGDHNARSIGVYTGLGRTYLENQVPFLVWGYGPDCGTQLKAPAGHRDMFPTLFPLLGIGDGYVMTGRDLFAKPVAQPLSLSYFGPVRSARGSWTLGNSASFKCTPEAPAAQSDCRFDEKLDAQARAQLGLLDWNVRSSLR